MAIFSRGAPRLAVLLLALAAFCLISPETLSRGPDLCLWRNLFHLHACPACGSTRALAAFFHGRFLDALSYNRNVIVSAPGMLALIGADLVRWIMKSGRPLVATQYAAASRRLIRNRDAH